jgi:heme O synthase-like polyprenyltransferase
LTDDGRVALKTFHYSISYLVALFTFLLLDHYMAVLWPA